MPLEEVMTIAPVPFFRSAKISFLRKNKFVLFIPADGFKAPVAGAS